MSTQSCLISNQAKTEHKNFCKIKNNFFLIFKIYLRHYLGHLKVNGPLTPLVTDLPPRNVQPVVPPVPAGFFI